MKSEKIKTYATILRKDSGCIGCMGPETPYILFKLDDGRELLWWSDEVDSEWRRNEGDTVKITAFVRQSTGRLFRVRISSDPKDYVKQLRRHDEHHM
jgi:hypothetical protein